LQESKATITTRLWAGSFAEIFSADCCMASFREIPVPLSFLEPPPIVPQAANVKTVNAAITAGIAKQFLLQGIFNLFS
jgi:hypothetical protein